MISMATGFSKIGRSVKFVLIVVTVGVALADTLGSRISAEAATFQAGATTAATTAASTQLQAVAQASGLAAQMVALGQIPAQVTTVLASLQQQSATLP